MRVCIREARDERSGPWKWLSGQFNESEAIKTCVAGAGET